jgi:hypothetical protein
MPLTKLNSASVIERLPVGSVIQTEQSRDNTVQTITNEITNLTGGIIIIPTSSSNEILVTATINLGNSTGTPNWAAYFRRGTTDLGQFTDGNRYGGLVGGQTYSPAPINEHMESHSFSYLDSPASTSAITYYVRMSVTDGGVIVNRVGATSDSTWAIRGYTTITLQEIKQ